MFSQLKEAHTPFELRTSRALENHASMVMCTIDEAINNVDDVDYVIDMLKNVGQTHTRFDNFKPEVFLVGTGFT